MKKNFKVLSIDGGGIKGLYSATILKLIEEDYGINLHEHFDMFCGTSTGGIIALGLAKSVPIQDIVQFYIDWGPKIFPNTNMLSRFIGGVRQLALFGKYSDKELKEALISVFGDTKIGELNKQICIPAVRLSNQRATIFKKDHSPELRLHNDIKLVDVALATSAAPTYFPIQKLDIKGVSGYYIDGGLSANDPSIIGAIEASKYFVGPDKSYEKFDLLSVASVGEVCGLSSITLSKRWSPFILLNIMDIVFSVQSSTHYYNMLFLKDLLPCDAFTKVPSPLNISKKQMSCMKLDLASKSALETLSDLALNTWTDVKKSDDLKRIFDL